MDGTGFNYFENTGYRNERKRMHSVYVKNDTSSHNDNHAFVCHLIEPLRIGKVAEVYLDYFLTYDIGAAQANTNGNKSSFVMDIKEFNIKSKSNIPRFHSKIVIPNEDAIGSGTKIHKGRKMNYVATINPGVYHTLSGTITDFLGNSMFSDDLDDLDGHTSTFSGGEGDAIPVQGGFTVYFHYIQDHSLINLTLIVDFSTAASTNPVEPFTSDGQQQTKNIIVHRKGSLEATMDEAVLLISKAFEGLPTVPTVTITSNADGLLFKNLMGGTITSPNSADTLIQNASDVAIDVAIDSPHFAAEFVIIEKD